MIIYCIQNKINGKCYVGQTIQPLRKRISAHRSQAKLSKRRKNSHIGKAIYKHPWESFEVSVLQQCNTLADLNEAEKFWIDKLGTLVNGYNLKHGGNDRGVVTLETRAKMSAAMRGFKHSDDTKLKLSNLQKGRKHSSEHVRKSADSLRGYRHTAESKLKRSGENNPQSRLTWDDVRVIRARALTGESYSVISKDFPVSKNTVRLIVLRRKWANESETTEEKKPDSGCAKITALAA